MSKIYNSKFGVKIGKEIIHVHGNYACLLESDVGWLADIQKLLK